MPELSLRGVCAHLDVDTNFTMITSTYTSERYNLQGWTHSMIAWYSSLQAWAISSIKQNGTLVAICNDTADYPLGTHKWYFQDPTCTEDQQQYRLLNLHSCKGDEVPCRNGQCIPLRNR